MTIVCAGYLVNKLILLKSQGKTPHIKNIISMDIFDKSTERDGLEIGIKVLHILEVILEGKKHLNKEDNIELSLPSTDDIQVFCYTSGTTGDCKAAMLSNKNLMSAASALLMVPGF